MNRKLEIPRRYCVDLYTPAEKAIAAAIGFVEAMPADVRLTDAVVLLGRAQERVADFVDGTAEIPETNHPEGDPETAMENRRKHLNKAFEPVVYDRDGSRTKPKKTTEKRWPSLMVELTRCCLSSIAPSRELGQAIYEEFQRMTLEEEKQCLRAEQAENVADLMRDEFLRIKACPGRTEEIAGLCDRAIKNIHQWVPVIVQRDNAEAEASKQRLRAEELDKQIEGWVEFLGVKYDPKRKLVMWPDTDPRWYALQVAIAGGKTATEGRNDRTLNLKEALKLAATRMEILVGRMKACHVVTGNHELLDEAEMFCKETRNAIAEAEKK